MDMKKIKKQPSQKKSLALHIRITKDVSKWLKEKDYSPTGIMNEAIKELGYKEGK